MSYWFWLIDTLHIFWSLLFSSQYYLYKFPLRKLKNDLIRIQNGEMDDKIFDMWNSIQRYDLFYNHEVYCSLHYMLIYNIYFYIYILGILFSWYIVLNNVFCFILVVRLFHWKTLFPMKVFPSRRKHPSRIKINLHWSLPMVSKISFIWFCSSILMKKLLMVISHILFFFQGGSSSNSSTPSRPQRQTKETEK